MPNTRAKVKLNKLKLDGWLALHVGAWVRLGLTDISTGAAIRTPVETGRLRSSRLEKMRYSKSKITGWVYTRVVYAGWVHDGRGAIVPIHAKALRFVINGRVIFAKRVGPSRAQPYLSDAAVAWARKKRLHVIRGSITG